MRVILRASTLCDTGHRVLLSHPKDKKLIFNQGEWNSQPPNKSRACYGLSQADSQYIHVYTCVKYDTCDYKYSQVFVITDKICHYVVIPVVPIQVNQSENFMVHVIHVIRLEIKFKGQLFIYLHCPRIHTNVLGTYR